MSVRIADDAIHLEGRCLLEDAEDLMLAIERRPDAIVDLSGVQRLHMAVVQVLLTFTPRLHGTPMDPFLSRYVFGQKALD